MEEVRLFLKNELEDADTKCTEIKNLLCWLKEHRNRRFDWEIFWNINKELFANKYTYIVIGGAVTEVNDDDIVVEQVRGEEELEGTVLTNTPILFWVEETSMKKIS